MAYLRSDNSQLKQQLMKNNSTLLRSGPPAIYQIHTQDTFISGDIRKCQLGTAKDGSTEKVIMMVGATGSGKSTMIDAMFNYVVDAKLEDPFRFKLVDESELAKTGSTQADSQTSKITAYTLHHQDGFAVPCTLTIIDTPGFGDTRGKEEDKKIMEQIKLFFTTAGDAGIDHIDAVGFVVKANDARLIENQKYIFNSVLSLWGNNIKGNIFMFFPFSDMDPPTALEALKSANIPYEEEKYYTFNNSALFRNVQDRRKKLHAKLNWEMNAEGFHQFLMEHLEKAEPKSLILSQSVLDLRELFEICQKGNKDDIQKITSKQEGLNAKLAKLKKDEIVICQEANTHEKDIENIKKEMESLNAQSAMLEEHKTIYQNGNIEDIQKVRRKQHNLNAQFAVLQNHEIIICQEQNLEDILNFIVIEERKLEVQLAVVEKQKTDLGGKEYYTFKKVLKKHEEVEIKNIAINCSKCEKTCLDPCKTKFVYTSSIFRWGGGCVICNCSFQMHNKESIKHKHGSETIEETDEKKKERYSQKQDKLRKEADKIANKLEELRKKQDEIKKQQENQRKKADEIAKEQDKQKRMEADEITKLQKETILKAEEMEKQLKQIETNFEIEKQKKEKEMKADKIEQEKLLKEIEGLTKQLEADEKFFFGLVMVKRIIMETLHEIALQPVDKTAGEKKRDYTIYIETLILFEKNEKTEGWERCRQQLQKFHKSMSLEKMAGSEELDYIQQMMETEENEARIKQLQELQKFLSLKITAGWEELDYIEQMRQTEIRERMEGWKERIQQLQGLQNKYLAKAAGWKECGYMVQMIQTEEKEGKQGWKNRTKQLQELLLKSEKLSHEWNKVLDRINPDYKYNTELSPEDNEKCRKSQKIIAFKRKVQLFDKIEN